MQSITGRHLEIWIRLRPGIGLGASFEEASQGKAFLCLVGLVLEKVLRQTWEAKLKESFSSPCEVLDAMEPIRYCVYLPGDSHMTPFNPEQLAICEAFAVTPPADCQDGFGRENE